ncbi:hypothetical protein BX666DRAFT_2033455 [Dichotomocladium elegans]|nr:hypothetical protein BX666DRAFT_2033455 [Dichotomocladium elegans]
MATTSPLLQTTEQDMGTTPSRPVRVETERTDQEIRVLEMGPNSASHKCHADSLAIIQPCIHQPTMEPITSDHQETTARNGEYNSDHPAMAVGHLVPDDQVTVLQTSSPNSSPGSHLSTRDTHKRIRQESPVETVGMEHKLRRLTMAGANDDVRATILHPDR